MTVATHEVLVVDVPLERPFMGIPFMGIPEMGHVVLRLPSTESRPPGPPTSS